MLEQESIQFLLVSGIAHIWYADSEFIANIELSKYGMKVVSCSSKL